MVNTTTPFKNVTWFKLDYDFTTKGSEMVRYIQGAWPDNTALLNSKTKFRNLDVTGQLHVEFPVQTRHIADIDYSIKNDQELTTGTAKVNYNNDQVLDGKYTCQSESRAGFEQYVVDMEVRNKLRPIGLHYVHSRNVVEGPEKTYDLKRAELFELKNSKMFNITGELHVTTRPTGQDYKIVAIHPNRTVILTSNYDYENNTTQHNSMLQLAPHVWLAYDWHVKNLTRADNESQAFSFDLSYPKRSLGAAGWYSVTKNTFDSDVEIKWHNKDVPQDEGNEADPKILKAALQWRNNQLGAHDKDNQTTRISLGHPSFEKDMVLKGLWYRGKYDLLRVNVEADYCDDPYHLLTFDAVIKDNTRDLGYRNYTYIVKSIHEISELNLDVEGSVGLRPGLYETSSSGKYKRGYLPLQEGVLVATIDLREKELYYLVRG